MNQVGDRVRIISKQDRFDNMYGVITTIYPLSGSDSGCGNNISIMLDDGYVLDVNCFTTIRFQKIYLSPSLTTMLPHVGYIIDICGILMCGYISLMIYSQTMKYFG